MNTKRILILAGIAIIAILLYLTFTAPVAEAEREAKFYYMTVTAYSLHPNCIADKHNNGLTAMNTPIREGVAAINVDYIVVLKL